MNYVTTFLNFGLIGFCAYSLNLLARIIKDEQQLCSSMKEEKRRHPCPSKGIITLAVLFAILALSFGAVGLTLEIVKTLHDRAQSEKVHDVYKVQAGAYEQQNVAALRKIKGFESQVDTLKNQVNRLEIQVAQRETLLNDVDKSLALISNVTQTLRRYTHVEDSQSWVRATGYGEPVLPTRFGTQHDDAEASLYYVTSMARATREKLLPIKAEINLRSTVSRRYYWAILPIDGLVPNENSSFTSTTDWLNLARWDLPLTSTKTWNFNWLEGTRLNNRGSRLSTSTLELNKLLNIINQYLTNQ